MILRSALFLAALALCGSTVLAADPPRIGDPGSVFDPKKFDPAFPDAREFAKAGVEGGIPAAAKLAAKLKPGDDLQAALNAAPKGSAVVLAAGVYKLDKPLAMKTGVILRGAGPEKTVLEYGGQDKDCLTVLNFKKVEWAAVEDLAMRHAGVAALDPKTYLMKYENFPGFKHNDDAAVQMDGASNCWIQNCQILFSVSRPLRIYGKSKHVTVRDTLIDKCLHKGGGGSGYCEVVGGEYVLFYNDTIKNIRHVCLDGDCAYTVLTYCQLAVDVNWHCIAPMDKTLVERCVSEAKAIRHPWGLFSHYKDAVGKDNYIYLFKPEFDDGAVYGPVWAGEGKSDGPYIQKKSAGPRTGTLYPVTGIHRPLTAR